MTQSIRLTGVWIVVFAAVVGLGGLRVSAQVVAGSEVRQQVTANVSAFGGYDTDVTAGSVSDPRVNASGSHIGSSISLRYRARPRRIEFSAQGDADLRRYDTAQSLTASTFFGSGVIRADLTPRLEVRGSVQSSYLPQFQFTLASQNPFSEVVAPSLDRSLARGEILSFRSDAALVYNATRRSHFELAFGGGRYTVLDSNYEMTTRSFAGAFSRNLTRYSTLRIGYGEQHANYPDVGRPRLLRNRTLDAGVGYSRPLSATRRTTVGFGSGSAIVENGPDQFFTVTGHASITHLLAKTWRISGVYSRGLAVVGGFVEPFFADVIATTLEGVVKDRLIFTASAGYSNGNVGMGPRANDYWGTDSNVRLEVPFRRRELSLFASYFFYGYSFNESVAVPVDLARGVNRHGVRGGLTLRVPLFVQRRPRAPR